MDQHEIDLWHMRRALALAVRGEGRVEPNPMVGCVVAQRAEIIGEGFHRRFGGDHAEVEALRIAGNRAAGATLYVTLEPCCHKGKTPPCTKAILDAGIRRVVVAQFDPFVEVQGQGIKQLQNAGLVVEVGLLEQEGRDLNAPYRKLLATGKPWMIAKWAMTLDGKIATPTGESRWISSSQSREIVHALRGRVDAIMVGRETALRDNPLLTARPPGPRSALRIVLDTNASLASDSQLAQTALQTPVLVAVGNASAEADRKRLQNAGCEVLVCEGKTQTARLDRLLTELGRRRLTNVLVEGGARLLGSLFDAQWIDEVHVFIAPKIFGGATAPSPIAGNGVSLVSEALQLQSSEVQCVADDIYLKGRSK